MTNHFSIFRSVKRTCEGAIIKGLDTKVRQAVPMFPEDGEKFWIRGVFVLTSSQALQYAVFFYYCKIFGPRVFDEHRNLEILIIVYFISSLDWLCEQLQI